MDTLKMFSGKKKLILTLIIILLIVFVYLVVNTQNINCSLVIDKERSSTDDYSNVELNVKTIKLPFDYFIISGHISLDNQTMPLGTFRRGKYQMQKIRDKRYMSFFFYNPKNSTEEYQETKLNITGGSIVLSKEPFDLSFSSCNIHISRVKVNTTLSQGVSLSGVLINKDD